MAILTANELAVGYERQPVLKNINFQIEEGDYFCIVGENGSGKTTLMKTILGLLPPVEGSIEVGQGLMKNQIGYLPQQSDVQRDFPATVYEIVLSGCQSRCGRRPFYIKEEKELAAAAMENELDAISQAARDAGNGRVACTANMQDTTVKAQFICDDARTLSVAVTIRDDATYRVDQWKMASVQQEVQGMGTLWSGA